MACQWMKIGDTVVHVNMGRGKPALCQFCKKQTYTKLCDFEIRVGDVGHKRTCDAKMCDDCAIHLGPEQDVCPNHNFIKKVAR